MKHFARLFFITITLLRFGVDEIALGRVRQPWLRALARLIAVGRSYDEARGPRLRQALERLGPIFIKFGQVLSTRRDLLPPDIADELAFLQDRVPPFPSSVAIATIERAFRRPVGDVFVQFDETPIASASIAQVHFATLKGAPTTCSSAPSIPRESARASAMYTMPGRASISSTRALNV